MIVVSENRGGSYILAEMTGAVWQQKVGKFRVIPYFAREKIELPEGVMAIIDTNEAGLAKIRAQPDTDKYSKRDYLMDGVKMKANADSDSEPELNTEDDFS